MNVMKSTFLAGSFSLVSAWAETWRQVWGTEKLSRTKFSNNIIYVKNLHFNAENF